MNRSLIFLVSLSILPTMINAAEIACGAVAALGCLGIGGVAYHRYDEPARDRETVQNSLERILLAHERALWGSDHENRNWRPEELCCGVGKLNAFFGYDISLEEMADKFNVPISWAGGVKSREEERRRVPAARRRSLQRALNWVERIEKIPTDCICPLTEEPRRAKVLERLVLYDARMMENPDHAKEKPSQSEKLLFLSCGSEEKKYQDDQSDEALRAAFRFKLGYQELERETGRTSAMRRPSLQKAINNIDALVAKKYPQGLDVQLWRVVDRAAVPAQQLAAPQGPVAGQ